MTLKIEDLPSLWQLDSHTEWLIEGLIPLGSVVLISGESGSGKSTLTLALADAVANGKPFLNREVRQRPVLIVDKENGKYTYCDRRDRLHLEESPDLHVWGHWINPEPDGPEDLAIRDFVGRTQPLIIFDSLISFHPGSEQDASETRDYMQEYRRLTAGGATVIVIHHTGKGENTKNYRGSSDIKASVDAAFVLTGKSGLQNLKLRPFKAREGVIEEINLRYHDGKFIEEQDHDAPTVEEAVRNNAGSTQLALIKILEGSVPQGRVKYLLERAVAGGRVRVERGAHNSYAYFPV